ncbi:MAG: molybdenum cofactor guanylyltransferase [Nitrososphaerota archaeon]|jgi:molybdopterin-guanine dinucleotide biosynthesis protein A|nr:molybdenum cofactor guanylyltransferase [Nitrososphaerota archaeon]
MVRRVAFVLAGGKACRFQMPLQGWQDKCLALFEGKPFLVHAIENASCVVDEVIVCINDDAERRGIYLEVLEKHHLNARIVVDEKADVGGPMRAIFTGLRAVQADFCLTIPCDMPFVKPKIVGYLFSISEDFEVVMPMWPNGKLETLFMVLKRSIILEIVQTLCQLGRSHVDDIPRAAAKTLLLSPVKDLKTLDPELKSFININTLDDLKKLQPRNIQGPVKENIQLCQEGVITTNLQLMHKAAKMSQSDNFVGAQEKFDTCKKHFETYNNFFWTALACEGKGAFFDAANNYDNEAKIYEKNNCTRLLERALADKALCETHPINTKTDSVKKS